MVDVAGDLVGEFDIVVHDYFKVNACEVGVVEECQERGLAFISLVLRNTARVQVRPAQSRRHGLLGDIQDLTDLKQLSTDIPLLRPRVSHQELPPEGDRLRLNPELLPIARKYRLRSLAVGSRMRSLSIAAASIDLPNSPAVLITGLGGRLSYALAVLDVKDECIVKRSAKN